MAMSLGGGRRRARRRGGSRDLRWVDNKPQSSSRRARALSSPRLFLFLSETPERLVERANRAERPFPRELLFIPAERGLHPLVVIAIVVVVVDDEVRHSASRARACVTKYAIAIASVRQARRHAQERTLRSDVIPSEGHTRHTRTRRSAQLTGSEASVRVA